MYQNVKHVMIPIEPVDPAQIAWIEETAALVVAYSVELHGECDRSQELDSYFVQTAAELLWNSTGGKPCWSELDVDAYVRLHGESRTDDEWYGHAATTMLAFYRWLIDNGHLEAALAVDAVRRLEGYVNRWLEELGMRPVFPISAVAAVN